MNAAEFIYLASGSPRRRALLEQIGVSFRVQGIELDETAHADEAAAAYVGRLAEAKSAAGWQRTRSLIEAPVLAADTAVVLGGRILGKPRDMKDAVSMLLELSGRTHEVLTAVALRTAAGTQLRLSRSTVVFRTIEPAEAREYWSTGEPRDKAGGYAVQGYAAVFIADLKGSYSGVMGLPLFETAQLLDAAGIGRWRRDEH